MKKLIFCLILILTINMTVGCSNNTSPNITKEPEDNIPLLTSGKNKDHYYKEFKKAFPDAEIIREIMIDIDDDKTKELFVVFNSKELRSALAVVTESNVQAISLNDKNTNFQILDSDDSLKTTLNPNEVILTLYDPSENLTIEFHITINYNASNNEFDFKIESKKV